MHANSTTPHTQKTRALYCCTAALTHTTTTLYRTTTAAAVAIGRKDQPGVGWGVLPTNTHQRTSRERPQYAYSRAIGELPPSLSNSKMQAIAGRERAGLETYGKERCYLIPGRNTYTTYYFQCSWFHARASCHGIQVNVQHSTPILVQIRGIASLASDLLTQ